MYEDDIYLLAPSTLGLQKLCKTNAYSLHTVNKLLRMFSYCTIDVKMELFRSYCSSLYCCSLLSDYRNASYKKLTVTFNNVHRRMLNLPWRCSASAMYVNYNLPNIDTVIRRKVFVSFND